MTRRSTPLPARSIAKRRAALVAGTLVVAAIVTAILVGPTIRATGSFAAFPAVPLGTRASAGEQRALGDVQRSPAGYLVKANGIAQVTIPLRLPRQADAKTLVRLWVYDSAQVRTSVSVLGADGAERLLGPPGIWVDRAFDVTHLARGGKASLRITSVNHLSTPVLFVDGVAAELAPHAALATASTWSVALLVLLVAAALLAVFGRLRDHWPLPLALAVFAALVWHRIPSAGLQPLPVVSAATWSDAVSGSWLGFHNGLLWGSWIGVSSLAVQIYHAFIPIVGNSAVSARSAASLAALITLAVIYALGHRAAGRPGAIAATLILLAATPLRDAAVDATALPVLILVGAVLAYGLHACVGRGTPLAVAMVAAGLSLAALAEPLWLPGAAVALVAVVVVCGEPGMRRRAFGAGALVMVILVGPYLTSTAAQNNGRPFAALDAVAVAARNAEFTDGSHGAPSALQLRRDPTATGSSVSLSQYVFGDHSLTQVAGSTLSGGQQALSAFGAGGVLAGIALALALIGCLYVLILPRMRALALVPILVVLPTLFVAGRIATDDVAAGAAWWPVLPLSAAILMYAAISLTRPALAPHLASLRAHARRRPQARLT